MHGGSSLNPFVSRMLADQLGESSSLFGTVRVPAHPFADWVCCARSGADLIGSPRETSHAGRANFVEPLGILVSDGSAEELLPAGIKLPFPNPDAVEGCHRRNRSVLRLRTAQPEKSSSRNLAGYAGSICQARHAGNIKVAIPDSAVPGTPVRIQLRVDADKTLRCWSAWAVTNQR